MQAAAKDSRVDAFEMLLLRLTHMYPLYRGRGRLALSRFLRNQSGEAAELTRVSLLSGEEILVVESDYIGRMVRFFGDLDPAISGVVRNLVRRGDVVLDIGANVGVVTLQMASLVGADGHVFAFEPVERLSALLSRSVAANRFENVSVLKVALSDVAGQGSMKVADGSLGCSTLSLHIDGEPCEIRRLDDMELGPGFRKPRLLKIDVEGHEAKVFAGGRAFLDKFTPDYILFESHSDRGGFWGRPEVEILREHGYTFAVLSRSVFGRPLLREVAAGDSDFSASHDFLATSREAGR